MAQDVLCLTLYDLEQDGKAIPDFTKPQDITTSDEPFTTVIVVDTEAYHRSFESRTVKKTLTSNVVK